MYSDLPVTVVVLGDSPVLDSAKAELIRGIRGMLARTLREDKNLSRETRHHPGHTFRIARGLT